MQRILEDVIEEGAVMKKAAPVDTFWMEDLMRDVYLTPDCTEEDLREIAPLHVQQTWMFCTDGCRDGGSGPVMCREHWDVYAE